MENTVIETPDNGGKEEGNKIILNGLKKSQKDKLLTLGVSGIVGILGGIGAVKAFSFVNKDNVAEPDIIIEPIDDADPIISEPVIIYTEAPFATTVDSSMSFGEAFSTARDELGQGGFFEWKGNAYNTYYKEEWNSLAKSEQNVFLDSIDQNATEIVVDAEIDVNNDTNPVIYEIDEEDYIEAAELNQDGIIDSVEIDVSNDANTVTPDIIIDVHDDYSMDQIMLDAIFEADATDNEVNISDTEDVIPNLADVENEDEDNDAMPDDDLNPDIDNDVDMGEYY